MLGFLSLLAFLLPTGFASGAEAAVEPVSYWLWAGVSAKDLPAWKGGPTYIYQGVFETRLGQTVFTHKGIYPYPLPRGAIYLVYRMKTPRPDPSLLVRVYQSAALDWEKHGIKVEGLQIDADTPTSRLDLYAAYVATVKSLLPGATYLNVTALPDWIETGAPNDLAHLAAAVDYMSVQLYQGHDILLNETGFLEALKRLKFPFKVGILSVPGEEQRIESLSDNPYYRGAIVFVQRKPSGS